MKAAWVHEDNSLQYCHFKKIKFHDLYLKIVRISPISMKLSKFLMMMLWDSINFF